MAEALFRAALKGRTDVSVSSAGVAANWGQPASGHVAEVLRPMGVRIEDFRSQPLTEDLVSDATHIIANIAISRCADNTKGVTAWRGEIAATIR